jgi:uncharacterized membrane protein YphA (DoxX/SURF4 family)
MNIFSIPEASAHEVYVLDSQQISSAIEQPSVNPFTAITGQEWQFLGWGVGMLALILIVLKFSLSPLFEKIFDPFLRKLKRFAPIIARVTFGFAVMFAGYFGDFFGPELPVSSSMPPGMTHAFGVTLMVIGACIVIGFMTRIMAFVMAMVFALAASTYHGYMLMYVNYLGEAILFVILGGGEWSLDRAQSGLRSLDDHFKYWGAGIEKYSFFILRVLFGVAVVTASFYAKFLHSNLAMDTVTNYHLTNYFPFTPLFLVLGAFIIEALAGICFAIGFEIRFFSLFLTFFLTLSLLFFGEAVWPHLILFGITATLFAHGYDRYTVEMALFQRKREGEPVL